jgi:PAS domain S-box-containing protein
VSTTTAGVHRQVNPVRRITIIAGTTIALALLAILIAYPIDPNPDWLDIFEEGVFLLGGLAAAWAASRVASRTLMIGTLVLTAALAIELGDEFVQEPVWVGDWLTALLTLISLGVVAWSLAQVGTREQKGRQALASSEDRFQRLFELSPISLAVSDAHGAFLDVNDAFERATGYRREELVGKRPSAFGLFLDPDTGQQFLGRVAHADGPVRGTVQVRTRAGAVRSVNLVVQRITLPEGPALMGAAYDVTDQTTLLREIERYQGQLELAAMKDEFIATMSHELRTPLTSVLEAAGRLQHPSASPLTSEQRRSVESVATNAGRLLSVINDILELSRLDSGRAVIQREPVSIEPACEAALTAVANQIQKKWIDADVSVARGMDSIFTDSKRLNAMLVELLDNAVKFTPAGGRIGLNVKQDTGRGTMAFTVWDSGPGIDPSDHERLFQPFVRLHSDDDSENGPGLGLALVRRTARALGGDANVDSSKGKGSRFTIRLPLNPPAR